jgi:hypothetical protein
MKITEITDQTFIIPTGKQLNKIRQLFAKPINVEIARRDIIPYFSSPLLVDLLNSIEKNNNTGDIRMPLVKYFDAEFPTFAEPFKNINMLRNGEGELSPLGHKDER